jgi:hypothetical protein
VYGTWKNNDLQNFFALALHMSIVGVESGMRRDSDSFSAWKKAGSLSKGKLSCASSGWATALGVG